MSWMQATKRPRMSMSKSSLASFRLPACLPACPAVSASCPPAGLRGLLHLSPAGIRLRDRARRPPPRRGRAGSAALGAAGPRLRSAHGGAASGAGERGVCAAPGLGAVRGCPSARCVCRECVCRVFVRVRLSRVSVCAVCVCVCCVCVRGGAETALRWAGAHVCARVRVRVCESESVCMCA